MDFSNLPTVLLQSSLPFLLVVAMVVLCLKYLRGSARRGALVAIALALGVAAACLWYYLIGPGR
ncbi:MAG: hypothetical protein ACI9K5_003531 [Gammaproteobacteria bacterium]|jgi:hypothetical protein